MIYKKRFKKKGSAPYQDHLYEPSTNWSPESNSPLSLNKEKKQGISFNVVSGFVTLLLVGVIVGTALFDSKISNRSAPAK